MDINYKFLFLHTIDVDLVITGKHLRIYIVPIITGKIIVALNKFIIRHLN